MYPGVSGTPYAATCTGPVVVNLSSSRMIDDVAAQYNSSVIRASVGEVNVVEEIFAHGAAIGGEGNGGVIVPAINPCRDSFVGMALLLEALAQEGGTISEMRARVPSYTIIKEKISCPAREIAPALRRLQTAYLGQMMDTRDGVKIIWPDRWAHARGSNTEPIIRLTIEAPTEIEAKELLKELAGQLEVILGISLSLSNDC